MKSLSEGVILETVKDYLKGDKSMMEWLSNPDNEHWFKVARVSQNRLVMLLVANHQLAVERYQKGLIRSPWLTTKELW